MSATEAHKAATSAKAKRHFDIQQTPLWRLKVRLQFTGWLQYVINGVFGVALLLLAGIAWLIGPFPALVFASLAALAFVNVAFDLVTVKFGIRPRERLPHPRTDMDAWDLMRSRRACRSFQSRDLTPEHHEALMASVARRSDPDSLIGERPVRLEYVGRR